MLNKKTTPNSSTSQSSADRDLEFVYEVGTLRFLQRTWRQFLSPFVQNVSEHSYRVAWIAQVIAAHESGVDTGKLVKMALAHDIAESRTGDVHYVSRQYTARNEDLAKADIFAQTSLEKEMLALLEEYEKRDSLEAKIVKDADNLDCDLEIKELEAQGNSLSAAFADTRKRVYESQFFTETARKMWLAIQSSNPHDWHMHGRNRVKSGDWKR